MSKQKALITMRKQELLIVEHLETFRIEHSGIIRMGTLTRGPITDNKIFVLING